MGELLLLILYKPMRKQALYLPIHPSRQIIIKTQLSYPAVTKMAGGGGLTVHCMLTSRVMDYERLGLPKARGKGVD